MAPVKPKPYDLLGETQSYDGVSNAERNRIVSYRPQAPTYNTASLGRRSSQEDGTIVGGTTQISGGGTVSFQLFPAENEGTPVIGIIYGLINGTAPSGMNINNDPLFFITPSNNNFVYAVIEFNATTRAITSRTIQFGSSIPANTQTKAHFPIGRVAFSGEYSILYQEHVGNINFREYLTIVNGVLVREYVKIFIQEPIIFE